jgi:D-alanyl-D-alanine dipeptidase
MPKLYRIAIIYLLLSQYCVAQPCQTDAKTIHTKSEYLTVIQNDPQKKLTDLKKLVPGIVIDLRYATTNNFTKTVLYKHPVAYLHPIPANALLKVQQDLARSGLGLKIYDAFRPFSATCSMWRLATDRHFVANPRKGSNHNRGLAVDLTLIDLKTGKELDMGTGFDNFTDSASHLFIDLPTIVITNRKTLKNAMRKAGFSALPNEWWHYSWQNNDDYEVIDLDFDTIKEIENLLE